MERSEPVRWAKVAFEQSAVVYAWLGLPIMDTDLAFEKPKSAPTLCGEAVIHCLRKANQQGAIPP